jgi:hypothetical protein
MQIPLANVEFRLSSDAENVHVVTFTASGLKKNMRIEIENEDVEVDDNFFDIDAGIPKVVRIISHLPQELIKERLRLRAL